MGEVSAALPGDGPGPAGPAGARFALMESDDVAWFFDDPSAARGTAAAVARRIGLPDSRTAEIAVALAEAATNLTRHAVGGAIVVREVRLGRYAGLEFLAIDAGPGIADVRHALRDGVSSAGTMGCGLGAVSRLADAFDIHSVVGRGTVLAARFWPRDSAGEPVVRAEPTVVGLTRAISGERVCGDAWAAKPAGAWRGGSGAGTGGGLSGILSRGLSVNPGAASGGRSTLSSSKDLDRISDWNADWIHDRGPARDSPAAARSSSQGGSPRATAADQADDAVFVMLCDGLGHGPLAAVAGEAAVLAFRDARPADDPRDVLEEIHLRLRGTRGAAVAIARIEPAARRVLFCGVGNIAATLVGSDTRSGLVSQPGIVGHQMRGLRTVEAPLVPASALILHSDGLTGRWSADAVPGFFQHSPIVMAALLLREAGVRRDDASVVVAKGAW